MTGPGGVRFEGRSLDEALGRACEGLGSRLEELSYDVVEDGSDDGVVIEASVDPVAVAGLFLAEAAAAGGLELEARIVEGGSALRGELSGADVGLLTASKGRGLDALQYLCNRVLSRRLREHTPIHLDGDGFKERRARRLRQEAEEAAAEARRTGREVTTGPLTPAARREIHLALADDPAVETESDGDGFVKRVVVRPRRRR